MEMEKVELARDIQIQIQMIPKPSNDTIWQGSPSEMTRQIPFPGKGSTEKAAS